MGMLCLTRRVHERIRLRVPVPGGEAVDIWVMLIQVRRGHAQFAFTAPLSVEIKREELLEKNAKEEPQWPTARATRSPWATRS